MSQRKRQPVAQRLLSSLGRSLLITGAVTLAVGFAQSSDEARAALLDAPLQFVQHASGAELQMAQFAIAGAAAILAGLVLFGLSLLVRPGAAGVVSSSLLDSVDEKQRRDASAEPRAPGKKACPGCGAPNEPHYEFCLKCGAAM